MRGSGLSDDEVGQVVDELQRLWPGVEMVKGRPRHSESQGGIERSNRLVQKRLHAWMLQNDSKNWSIGLPFVQWSINTDYHSGIKKTPYEVRYGQKAVRGLTDLPLTRELSARLATEEDLWDALPEPFRQLLNEANDLIDSRKGETLCDDPRDSDSAGTHFQYKL